MKQLDYVDKSTFKLEVIEFSDEHYNIASDLMTGFANCSPLLVAKDKKSLCFAINSGKDSLEKEIDTRIYKVTIEKVN